MKKDFYRIFCIIMVSFICLFNISFADVGNFADYGSDYGSDFGSSLDSSYDSSYSGSSDLSFGEFLFIIIIFAIVIMYSKNKGGNQNYNSVNSQNLRRSSSQNYSSEDTLKKVLETDEYFNETEFLSFAKNLFVKLQNAWTDRDFETIRPLETEELFEQHSNQIKRYIDNKQINVMDRIAVNYAKLHSFEQDNDKDTLSVVLNSSMLDYIIDEDTKEVLQGDKTTRRTNTYLMTFIRKKGVKTKESTGELKTTNCPNCGAPTVITSAGKCEYCGSVIKTGEHDWVLSNLEPFR